LSLDVPVKLICSECKFPDLVAQLALHRLDLVISDEPMSKRISVKAFNHALGSSSMSFFCAPALKKQLTGAFPGCLNDAPNPATDEQTQGSCAVVADLRSGCVPWLCEQY